MLSTVGVVVTGLLVGAAAQALFDLSWLESILLGAVVASTDAAAVFATLRFTHIRRGSRARSRPSRAERPMAIALTLGLIAWIESPTHTARNLVLLVVRQLGLGSSSASRSARAATWIFARLPDSIGAVRAGCDPRGRRHRVRARRRHRGQRIPGRLPRGTRHRQHAVALPTAARRLPRRARVHRAGRSLHRPWLARLPARAHASGAIGPRTRVASRVRDQAVAVWASTFMFDFTTRERALLGWAGLRGAVPIVLATFVLSSDEVTNADTIFNAVFFVVVVSVTLQGTTLERVARGLDLVVPSPQAHQPPLEVGALSELDLIDFLVAPDHAIAGSAVRELGLPRTAIVAVVVGGTTRSRRVGAPSSSRATACTFSRRTRTSRPWRTSSRAGAAGSEPSSCFS
jgi:cell volume regulation protein A